MFIDNLEVLNPTQIDWIIHVKIQSICKEYIIHQGETLDMVLIDEKVHVIQSNLNFSFIN